ncbi:low molecular weight protein-tyrosine-phosphatase [Prochlorococcus sp. MIT 1223]|uniref:low molecular weight protein-tyrosine-phosphatase n=1 Tax=Prochlorococcus sp. MIT 1223 TaxID=3096217 RepID=UPI002A763927|nr:low molecular weight protein-tyrosine-phosphatase [Prochlorococcus sp. MIT 1223]
MNKRILFVCLGNICRSPAAEAIFLKEIEVNGLIKYFTVDSAGTGGWHSGNQADSRMRDAASKRGIDIQSRARKLNLKDFEKFDLILTMDNSNLSDVQSLAKKAGDKKISHIYPILKYATKTSLIEVPDPYYGGVNGFNTVLDLLQDAIEGLISSFNLDD